MSYLSDLLGDAYKEGMTEDEISTALESIGSASGTQSTGSEREIEKLKKRLSEVNSESAGYKKRLRELQSKEAAAADEQKEALEKLQAENADLKRSISLAERKASLLGQGFAEDLAESTATAMVDGDMDTVIKNMALRAETMKQEITAGALRSTPRPPAGSEHTPAIDYAKKIEEAQAAGNMTAAAYYTRLQAQETQTD